MRLSSLSLALAVATVLAGCTFKGVPDPQVSSRDSEWMALVPKAQEDLRYGRYLMDDPTGEAPGTIVVDTKERFLYYVLPGKKVIRYGVAVGDEAYGWTGTARVARKAEWPDWNPPAEMKARWPHVKFTRGGPENPLGARALYLYEGNRDTLYRIHGTNEPEKIGLAVSSGCIRMRNIDVIDLYNRVDVNTKVIVR
ncbi:L,D-transpeptidase [Microvirga thermotolerans]|uniref:L,D-transpeptidase family protein n=1 Tax=Microvirga thermotolerans TaxID=2651334 RepID=A0A5P9JUU8_9HYPH|nr:L,D-transpeptidase [Microvirga thermotolerans]QFU15891.1 L,D-transpeptidase family protein [Microvirga thermotolerans]